MFWIKIELNKMSKSNRKDLMSFKYDQKAIKDFDTPPNKTTDTQMDLYPYWGQEVSLKDFI